MGVPTETAEKLKSLKREVRELRQANEILRKASAYFAQAEFDRNDASAICRAVRQPGMKFVPGKSLERQDIQALHRGRQRLVNHRTALVAQMRGLLLDRGVAFAQSITRARRDRRSVPVDVTGA